MSPDAGPIRGLSRFRFALRRFLAASEEISRAAGVTSPQYQVLLAISSSDSGRLTMRALADELLLTHHAAVQMVDRLTKAGLAERSPSPTDRRAVLVGLTRDGEALVRALAVRHLDELLRQEPLIRSSLDQLKTLSDAAGASQKKGGAISRGPRKS